MMDASLMFSSKTDTMGVGLMRSSSKTLLTLFPPLMWPRWCMGGGIAWTVTRCG